MSINKKEIKNRLDEIINVIETGKNENKKGYLFLFFFLIFCIN